MTSWVLDGSADSIDRLVREVGPTAHRRLEDRLAAAEGLRSQQPTLLPTWTLGHLVSHLGLNAASHLRVLQAARQGRSIGQYKGGAAGRAAAIEADSIRPIHDLIAELADVNGQLEALWRELSPADWRHPTLMRAGKRPAFVSLWARWREVEFHGVDLGVAMTSDDWSGEFALAGLEVNFAGDELRSVHQRLRPGTSLRLFDGEREWLSESEQALTSNGSGTRQSLLAWLVGRQAASPIDWDQEPALQSWP